MKVVCIMTCFNRYKSTIKAVKQLKKNNCNIDFVIVDDNSSDGTSKKIEELEDNHITLLHGDGNLFYGGGMRKAMLHLLEKEVSYDYLLIINDDVNFYESAIDNMIKYAKNIFDSVIVGCTENDKGLLSYGGIKYKSKFSTKYHKVGIDNRELCDTFNGNCVLIPYNIFEKCGAYDEIFIHNFAEFDYGHTIVKKGYKIITYNKYIGICNNNKIDGTWYDSKLSKLKRLKIKESPKGAPLKVVFHYYVKNFNLLMAIRCCISGYIRILIK